jgi:hypothetical protein
MEQYEGEGEGEGEGNGDGDGEGIKHFFTNQNMVHGPGEGCPTYA